MADQINKRSEIDQAVADIRNAAIRLRQTVENRHLLPSDREQDIQLSQLQRAMAVSVVSIVNSCIAVDQYLKRIDYLLSFPVPGKEKSPGMGDQRATMLSYGKTAHISSIETRAQEQWDQMIIEKRVGILQSIFGEVPSRELLLDQWDELPTDIQSALIQVPAFRILLRPPESEVAKPSPGITHVTIKGEG